MKEFPEKNGYCKYSNEMLSLLRFKGYRCLNNKKSDSSTLGWYMTTDGKIFQYLSAPPGIYGGEIWDILENSIENQPLIFN